MQGHVVDDADVRKGEENLRSAARKLAVAQNVAVDAAAGEQPIGIYDTVDEVDDVDVYAEVRRAGTGGQRE